MASVDENVYGGDPLLMSPKSKMLSREAKKELMRYLVALFMEVYENSLHERRLKLV